MKKLRSTLNRFRPRKRLRRVGPKKMSFLTFRVRPCRLGEILLYVRMMSCLRRWAWISASPACLTMRKMAFQEPNYSRNMQAKTEFWLWVCRTGMAPWSTFLSTVFLNRQSLRAGYSLRRREKYLLSGSERDAFSICKLSKFSGCRPPSIPRQANSKRSQRLIPTRVLGKS